MRLRDIPWLAFALAAVCAWLAHRIGFDVGVRSERARVAMEKAMRGTAATRKEIAARNVVWTTFNGDDLPNTPERGIAFMLMRILSPYATADDRYDGLSGFRTKANAYLTDPERERLVRAFASEPSFFIDEALRILAARDAKASALVVQILQDRDRIDAYLHGRRIPLE